jgi:hypothetical protein
MRVVSRNVKLAKSEAMVYLPQPEQEQLPEEQVQELEEPAQPQSPFMLMVLLVFSGGGVVKTGCC